MRTVVVKVVVVVALLLFARVAGREQSLDWNTEQIVAKRA